MIFVGNIVYKSRASGASGPGFKLARGLPSESLTIFFKIFLIIYFNVVYNMSIIKITSRRRFYKRFISSLQGRHRACPRVFPKRLLSR